MFFPPNTVLATRRIRSVGSIRTGHDRHDHALQKHGEFHETPVSRVCPRHLQRRSRVLRLGHGHHCPLGVLDLGMRAFLAPDQAECVDTDMPFNTRCFFPPRRILADRVVPSPGPSGCRPSRPLAFRFGLPPLERRNARSLRCSPKRPWPATRSSAKPPCPTAGTPMAMHGGCNPAARHQKMHQRYPALNGSRDAHPDWEPGSTLRECPIRRRTFVSGTR